jgi:hypothetical protein
MSDSARRLRPFRGRERNRTWDELLTVDAENEYPASAKIAPGHTGEGRVLASPARSAREIKRGEKATKRHDRRYDASASFDQELVDLIAALELGGEPPRLASTAGPRLRGVVRIGVFGGNRAALAAARAK